ncbi:MAG: hypothetical protein HY687_00695 [Chloroflexi bacterium]|nr:hypothetical protein [Chloroflexota bacterium]
MPIEFREDSPVFICEACQKEHEEDNFGQAGCLVLRDEREQVAVSWVWCDEACLSQWLDSPEARQLFPTM